MFARRSEIDSKSTRFGRVLTKTQQFDTIENISFAVGQSDRVERYRFMYIDCE
jgi:hypothetical protein